MERTSGELSMVLNLDTAPGNFLLQPRHESKKGGADGGQGQDGCKRASGVEIEAAG
jgi:hypothetical protein